MNKPLLEQDQPPCFDRIEPEHPVPAIETTLSSVQERIGARLEAHVSYDRNNFAALLELPLARL